MPNYMPVADLPPYLMKPFSKSRMNNHVQTLLYVQLYDRTASRFYEIGISESVTTWRSRNGGLTGPWTRYTDTDHGTHDEALKFALAEVDKYEARGYRMITSNGLLMPLNETDTRYMRKNNQLSRSAIEWASQLFDSIMAYVMETSKELAEVAAKTAATPPPPVRKVTTPAPPTTATPASARLSDALRAFDAAKAAEPDVPSLSSIKDELGPIEDADF